MALDVHPSSNEKILRDLCDDIMGLVGGEFFSALIAKLAQVAGADYAFIGKFIDDERSVVRTVAVFADGHHIDNLDFDIKNTPCDAVVKRGMQIYPHSVLELFPLDHLAVKMEVDSYIGLPLVDSRGEVIGPLAVFSRKPMQNLPLLETALRMFALRAAAELERLSIEDRLQDDVHFLQSLIDAIPNPVFYKGKDGVFQGCNSSYEKLLGIARKDLIGCTAEQVVSHARAEIGLREDRRVFLTLQPSMYGNDIVCADGRTLHVLFNKAPFFDRNGQLSGLVGTIQDITSLKQVEAAMQTLVESAVGYTGSECYRRIAEQLGRWFGADCTIVGQLKDDGMVESLAIVRDGVLQPNHVFPLKNTPCEKVVKDGICVYSDGMQQRFPNSEIVQQLQAQGYVGAPVRSHDGTVIGVLSVLSRRPIARMERAKEVMAIMAARVSAEIEREESQQRLVENENHLKFLVYHDSLTQLPNRQMFRDRLQHAISMAQLGGYQLAVLFLNLDRFKKINDSLGHDLGDRMLCEVARRLKMCVREIDTVSRFGGDEFAIIIDRVTKVENVIFIAQQIRSQLAEVMTLDEYKLFITASIGISLYPHNGQDVAALLKSADVAMGQAKSHGRDNYRFYTSGINERASEMLLLENALREAIERDELEVYYQPQIDMDSDTIVGVEALLRWQHPEKGMISPGDFIPMAEETGLIVTIGEWVLRQACAQAVAWQQAGCAPLRMSVNMSARQFAQKNLVYMVATVLQETGLEPCWLDLEITESILMNDVDSAILVMMELHRLGIQLSIDDFGTGYSSLAYLKRFPIDTLKIDQSFVRDVVSDKNDAAIASSIIGLAQNMSLNVIAEGIEDEDQRRFLRERGCRYGQGYLFGRPQPHRSIGRRLLPSEKE